MWDGRTDLDENHIISTWDLPAKIKKPRNKEMRGYIKSCTKNDWEDWDEWYPCYDLEKILKMEDDSVIWETDRKEVINKLEHRYPCKTSGLTYIQASNSFDSRIFAYQKEVYLGKDTDKAARFAKKLGEILLGNSNMNVQRFEEKNCILRGFTGHCSRLVYNPKAIRTNKKRQKNNTKQQVIPAYMLESVIRQMWYMFARETGLQIAYPTGNRYHTHKNFKSCITLFNTFFGKNAHRHLESFQDLKKAWKFRKTVTEKKYLGVSLIYQGLINWMAIEITKNKPKKKELKPKKIFDRFGIFTEEKI
jgi:hypothetical protein